MDFVTEIKIELAHTKIVSFSAEVNIKQNTAVQIEASYSAEVYEPNDSSDPTAMVLVKSSMRDTTGKLLNVECTAQLYFKFEPIPEDRAKVIQEISRDTIQNELNQRIHNLLREMGQNIAVT